MPANLSPVFLLTIGGATAWQKHGDVVFHVVTSCGNDESGSDNDSGDSLKYDLKWHKYDW